ncbi:MAG: ATP-grasp domain-containing protein [Methanoculleaceae archaeon]
MSLKVLVAGFATRHVCRSAYRAGHRVYAVDHFCDRDLDWYTEASMRFEEVDELPDLIQAMAERHGCDLMVATSGAECLEVPLRRAGTPPERVSRFMDKELVQKFFEDLRIPVPPRALPGEYPAMIKPRSGAGGWRNALVRNDAELRGWIGRWEETPYILQKFLPGRPVSVSCIAGGGRAKAICVNEQFVRGTDDAPFGYSGSLTPARSGPVVSRLIEWAERAAGASGCTGSVGIDFICDGEEAVAIEINPRFQATLDTVELATGVNLFSLHLGACNGRIPDMVPGARRVAIRKIIFAGRDLTVRTDLSGLHPYVADIPRVGSEIEEGHAVVSVLACGTDRVSAFRSLEKTINRVHRCIREW